MLPKFHDDYHRLVRDKQREMYYFNNGKIRQQIRRYTRRYNLNHEFLNDCPTDEEKLNKLKKYASDLRLVKYQQKVADMVATQAFAA